MSKPSHVRHQALPLSVGQCATLACLLEATAPKAGNVHRGADFEDLTFHDFVMSSVVIAPAIEQAAAGAPVGQVVLSAVRNTQAWVGTNTNLGTLLLLAPLAAAPRGEALAAGVSAVLDGLTSDDARDIWQAINLAVPGGMGQVAEMDLADPPPPDLMLAMRAAAERDRIAWQYAHRFEDIFGRVVPWLVALQGTFLSLADIVVHVQLQLMAELPDSLIARKCGEETARRASQMAAAALHAGHPGSYDYLQRLADLDFWLRSDGHRRNPGTTADLIAAGLFVALREGLIEPPASMTPVLDPAVPS